MSTGKYLDHAENLIDQARANLLVVPDLTDPNDRRVQIAAAVEQLREAARSAEAAMMDMAPTFAEQVKLYKTAAVQRAREQVALLCTEEATTWKRDAERRVRLVEAHPQAAADQTVPVAVATSAERLLTELAQKIRALPPLE
jgi:hypothetical protein